MSVTTEKLPVAGVPEEPQPNRKLKFPTPFTVLAGVLLIGQGERTTAVP